jgi:hypothetical protein
MLQGPLPVSPLFWVLFLVIILGLVTICCALSYYIARSRWHTMMELRERHSPSREPDYDEEDL